MEENAQLAQENNTLKNLVLEKFNKAEILALEEENLAGPTTGPFPLRLYAIVLRSAKHHPHRQRKNDGITQENGRDWA